MKRLILVLISVGFFGVLGCGPGFQARKFCSGTFSVKAKVPLTFEITTSMDSMHRTALLDAARAIESQSGLSLFRFRLIGSPGVVSNDGHNQVMVYLSGWPVASSIQGQTRIHWSDEWIVDSDIYVNAVNYTYYVGEHSDYTKVHLTSLYIHEMLHALGLAHNHSADSVMYEYLGYGQVRTTLSAEDVAALHCLYN